MKKALLTMSWVMACLLLLNTGLWAAPLIGTWNAEDLGTAALNGNTDAGIFKGSWIFTDPERDGTNLGDQSFARDIGAPSKLGAPYYWASTGLTCVSITHGAIELVGDNLYRQSFETIRTGGTSYLFGDHLWGQAAGDIYVATEMQQVSTGYTYLTYFPELKTFGFQYAVGEAHSWGMFAGYPELMLEINSEFSLSGWASVPGYGQTMYGSLYNVELNISSVPEPAALLLLSAGIIGLAGTRRFKRGWR